MALTQISTEGIKNGTISTADLADESVTLAKLLHGTSSNDGKFLRANNGADPTFETVNTDLVSDTSPQLGGDLDTNSHEILLDDNHAVKFGAASGGDLKILHDGTNSEISNYTGTFYLFADSLFLGSRAAGEPYFKGFADGAAELYYNSNKKFETSSAGAILSGALTVNSGDIDIATDGHKIKIGAGDDLEIYHDTENYIKSATASVNLILESAHDVYIKHGGENMLKCTGDGAVELYYDNTKRFETTSTGISVTGNIVGSNHLELADNKEIRLGDSQDLQIYHSGFNYIESHNDMEVHINAYTGGAAENMAKFKPNGAVELYHNNSKKFNTNSGGVTVTGACTATSFSGDGSNLSNVNAGTLDGVDGSNYVRTNQNTTITSDLFVSGGAGALTVNGNSDLRFNNGNWTGNTSSGKIQLHSSILYICGGTAGIYFRENATNRWRMDGSGHFRPESNNTYDIGTSSYRVRNIYTNDLNLSNEDGANDVDGTWGSFTIQEGSEDLFLINRRNGKKYKFNLTEVS